jgi:2-polyprenyl-3-methyl-5-hydroxy-6-metoxy-1,4-benzoquinol methylase
VVETYTFFQVLGSVVGLDVLDVAAGEGRLSRMLIARGARTVVGTDVSAEMIRRARELDSDGPHSTTDGLRFEVVDARDEQFTLDEPADVVTAMYLFHYASSEDDLARMCRFPARNVNPGGRFVTYTINPFYDFTNVQPELADQFGFDYHVVEHPHYDWSSAAKASISGSGASKPMVMRWRGPDSNRSVGIMSRCPLNQPNSERPLRGTSTIRPA